MYNKVFPGQSAAGFQLGSISKRVSTLNLWWGPGVRYSLLMSNNAPGFMHFYIRIKRPAETPIGNFGLQLIGSRLDSDSTRPYENMNLKLTRESYPATWRYQSAFVLSYQPKWIPGLFVGMTRSLQRYQKDIGLGGNSFLKNIFQYLQRHFRKKTNRMMMPKIPTSWLLFSFVGCCQNRVGNFMGNGGIMIISRMLGIM